MGGLNTVTMVNGKYQYPIKGRDLPTVHSNDLIYNPKLNAVKSSTPRCSFGTQKKFLEWRIKENRESYKPGPGSNTPKFEVTQKQFGTSKIGKDPKKSKFDEVIGQGTDNFYELRKKDITKGMNHGYMSISKRTERKRDKVADIGQYEVHNFEIARSFAQRSYSICQADAFRNTRCDEMLFGVGQNGYSHKFKTDELNQTTMGPGQYFTNKSELNK